ncbi:hypothetical protein BT93_C2529 [Corymbia citriodora subsp. variegata]|nr:hypothetical protein BT93_C2529 [Corymbia citriodora subsp. variegata]
MVSGKVAVSLSCFCSFLQCRRLEEFGVHLKLVHRHQPPVTAFLIVFKSPEPLPTVAIRHPRATEERPCLPCFSTKKLEVLPTRSILQIVSDDTTRTLGPQLNNRCHRKRRLYGFSSQSPLLYFDPLLDRESSNWPAHLKTCPRRPSAQATYQEPPRYKFRNCRQRTLPSAREMLF